MIYEIYKIYDIHYMIFKYASNLLEPIMLQNFSVFYEEMVSQVARFWSLLFSSKGSLHFHWVSVLHLIV